MTELNSDVQASATTVVSRVVNSSINNVWATLVSSKGQTALLGEGAYLGTKGDTWKATDGTWGVTRTFHPLEELRFSWHANLDAPKTWVKVILTVLSPDQTRIELSHDPAGADFDVTSMTAHWEAVLELIA